MRRLTAATLSTLVTACGTVPQPGGGGDIAWTRFEWTSVAVGDSTFQRAGILVPFTADTLGGTYWLQLDTGADVGIWLYTAPLGQLLARHGAVRDTTTYFQVPRGSIGRYPLREEAVNIRRYAGDTVRAGDPHPKIGTLGLNFFRRRVLLVDFPAQRFAVLDSGALPAWIERDARWVPAQLRDSKVFLPLTLAGRTYDDFFWDSGASLFPISTTPEIWAAATGRAATDPGNVVVRVPSFGEIATLVGAPARGELRVGAAALSRPLIFHLAGGPQRLDMRNWGFRTSGLIGNALFAERHLVVLDLPGRRFGLLETRPPIVAP